MGQIGVPIDKADLRRLVDYPKVTFRMHHHIPSSPNLVKE